MLLTLKNIKLDLKEVFTTTAVSQQSSVLPICFFKALTDMALLTAVAGFYFTIFFFSHLQRKDSESTAKNPNDSCLLFATVCYHPKKYSQSSPDHSDQISCLTFVFFKFAFQTSGEHENGPGPAGPEYVNTLADLLSSAPLIVNGVHTCVLLACAL